VPERERLTDSTRRTVTGATRVTHRSGDKSVDSVDNSPSTLSLSVTGLPERVENSPRVGVAAFKIPNSGTERNSATGSKEPGAASTATGASTSRPQGRDLAKAALQAAKERAGTRGTRPGARRPGTPRTGGLEHSGQNPRRRRWSGPGFDERDPQPFGRLLSNMATQLGWSARLANGRVFGQWSTLVGAEIAEHAQPMSLNNGELTVRASSTAWATQLRLLQRQLLARIAAGVGHGVVTRMRIQGPTAPSWRKGPKHIPGRGPRDTYG
jgi:predicted nucleic acid-binding Zn ribbon protein